jgi:trk system potassium uptake protein TrkH
MPEKNKSPSRQRFIKPGDRIFRVPRPIQWEVILPSITRRRMGGGGISTTVIAYGFAAVILIGTLLLMLPVATTNGTAAHPTTALFTSSSAVCVTGLAVVDTADYWSPFGEGVILFLIQIGGFGFMTTATLVLLALGRRIGLRERLLIKEAMGVNQLGGVVRIVRQMLFFTIIAEVLGAALIYLRLSTQFPHGQALWKSIFHSISAFNNCGFDLYGGFRSLSDFQTDPLVILTTAGLIILGGISYMVISDVLRKRGFIHLSLDSKMVITTTIFLLALGTIVLLLTEMNNSATLGPLSLPQKILNAFFHAVTPRTAGFASLNIGSFAVYSLFFTMILMFVGGASGSTAGGIKVNTFGLLIATIISTLRGNENPTAFQREINTEQIQRALTLVILAVVFIFIMVFCLTITENMRFVDLLFETISAFGTVGLSTGITPLLSTAGRFLIILTMFVGRIGPLTLILSLTLRQRGSDFSYPKEAVRIG